MEQIAVEVLCFFEDSDELVEQVQEEEEEVQMEGEELMLKGEQESDRHLQ